MLRGKAERHEWHRVAPTVLDAAALDAVLDTAHLGAVLDAAVGKGAR